MARVSHEKNALEILRSALADLPEAQLYSGLTPDNRFDLNGWELTAIQRFQFGDLRVELPGRTVVVEFESAGGVGNLVKYWPLLADGTFRKRFLLIHVFRIQSANDYIAHRRLWDFLIERMRVDLAERGIDWPESWEALAFTYTTATADQLQPVVDLIRA